jgi:GNAT superfamily N-acetyltransferase
MDCRIDGPLFGQSAVCESILRALPDYFGIEEAIVHYAEDIHVLPTFLAVTRQGPVGFLTLKQNNKYTAELHVLGVLKEYHFMGLGRALLERAELFLSDSSTEYLMVKTLASSHPDPNYARTRKFYLSAGFRPLDEYPQIWGERNPCLIMVKSLAKSI